MSAPPDLTFRDARRDDLAAIVELLADDVIGRGRESASLESSYLRAFEAIEADPKCSLIVGESGGRVVAVMQIFILPHVNQRGGWRAQVESVHVAADLRSRGIGEALMGFAIERARQQGCVMVQLTTDKRRDDAKRFYQRLGFRASHEGMKLALKEPA
jgi:ribosomal protein S18 acetylase RimI-like enzyme